jgi:hypothetical protein
MELLSMQRKIGAFICREVEHSLSLKKFPFEWWGCSLWLDVFYGVFLIEIKILSPALLFELHDGGIRLHFHVPDEGAGEDKEKLVLKWSKLYLREHV